MKDKRYDKLVRTLFATLANNSDFYVYRDSYCLTVRLDKFGGEIREMVPVATFALIHAIEYPGYELSRGSCELNIPIRPSTATNLVIDISHRATQLTVSFAMKLLDTAIREFSYEAYGKDL